MLLLSVFATVGTAVSQAADEFPDEGFVVKAKFRIGTVDTCKSSCGSGLACC
jgi:hypothetical protein